MNSNDPYADRKRLTFEQAEGVEPLPSQLRPREISEELSALLWAMVYSSICRTADPFYLGVNWNQILFDYHVSREHRPADEYTNNARSAIQKVKDIIISSNYVQIFGFLQFVLRHRSRPHDFQEGLEFTLKTARAAYRIFDGDTIVPIGSEAELQTLERAFVDLGESEFQGARAHLKESGAALTAGDYSASIRESIHAVESVARTLWPANKLSAALDALERATTIHGALKKGFLSIYGYTSDAQGIRHPLLDSPTAKVDETDALFMIGACAAFVSYLIGKARSAGLLKKRTK